MADAFTAELLRRIEILENANGTISVEAFNKMTGHELDETLEQQPEAPATPYSVRIYYGDDTMEEIHNITGIQVANLDDGTFPVGFMATEDSETPVPGYFDGEGEFVPWVPQKRIGW